MVRIKTKLLAGETLAQVEEALGSFLEKHVIVRKNLIDMKLSVGEGNYVILIIWEAEASPL